MGMKASGVGNWLRRQHGGKRDHRNIPSGDYVVLRPGPNFDWLMGNPAAGQLTPPVHEQYLTGESRREAEAGRVLGLHRWPTFLADEDRQGGWLWGFGAGGVGAKSTSRTG